MVGRPDEGPDIAAEVTSRLADLETRPLREHVEVYDGVHRLLQDTLAQLDEV